MVKITMSDADYNSGNYFGEGVHQVTISVAVLEAMDDGREYVDIGVSGKDGEEGSARMWLHTDKAAKFTLRTLQSIAVHNAKTETQEVKTRAYFVGEMTNEKIQKILTQMVGYEAWYVVVQDPNRTYTNDDGEIKASYNRNVYGYEPTMPDKTKQQLIDELITNGAESVEDDDIPFND